MATRLTDAEAILKATDRYGVKLMVDFSNRWNPPFALAKQAIQRGELGELLYMNIKLNDSISVPTQMLSWAGQSSALWFLGTHTVDLALWLFESPLERVHSVSRFRMLKARGIPTADFSHSRLEFQDGVVSPRQRAATDIPTPSACWKLTELWPDLPRERSITSFFVCWKTGNRESANRAASR